MKLSIQTNKDLDSSGFTIVELVIVIGVLSILGSFAFPNILNTLKLNKAEEAKALMNGYASDCLGKYRVATTEKEFRENAKPEGFDDDSLALLGYQVDGNKSKCSELGIKPKDKNDKFLYAFSFEIDDDGVLTKIGTPPPPTAGNRSALNSCKGWAGAKCGMSEADKAKLEALKKLARERSDCISSYRAWLSEGNSGEFRSWNPKPSGNDTCTKRVWAFEGTPVSSADAVEEALKAKYGKACADWKTSKIENRNYISPNGKSETKNPECGGVPYWFHSGNIYTSKAAWTEYDNLVKKQACTEDRNKALSNNTAGKYVYGPTPGPDPCGKVVWLCRGEETSSIDAYNTTPCVQEEIERKRKQKEEEERKRREEEEKEKKKKEEYEDKYSGEIKSCPDQKPPKCRNPRRAALLPECDCWK